MSVAASAKAEDSESEEAEKEEAKVEKKEDTGIIGLNGDMALSKMSKN